MGVEGWTDTEYVIIGCKILNSKFWFSSASLAIKKKSVLFQKETQGFVWFSLQYSKHYENKRYILLFFGQDKTR